MKERVCPTCYLGLRCPTLGPSEEGTKVEERGFAESPHTARSFPFSA